jgi:hypothetical protein
MSSTLWLFRSRRTVPSPIPKVGNQRPELIENLMLQEHWRQQDYFEAAWDILELAVLVPIEKSIRH